MDNTSPIQRSTSIYYYPNTSRKNRKSRVLILATPKTPDQVPLVVSEINEGFSMYDKDDPATDILTVILGNLTISLISKIPSLIIANPYKKEAPIFVPFNRITSIKDEIYLEKPCNFIIFVQQELGLPPKGYRFSLDSSRDYLDWIYLLNAAFEKFGANRKEVKDHDAQNHYKNKDGMLKNMFLRNRKSSDFKSPSSSTFATASYQEKSSAKKKFPFLRFLTRSKSEDDPKTTNKQRRFSFLNGNDIPRMTSFPSPSPPPPRVPVKPHISAEDTFIHFNTDPSLMLNDVSFCSDREKVDNTYSF